MRALRLTAAILTLAVIASGCATGANSKFSTFNQSALETVKRAEVVVSTASQQQITDALTTRMRATGWVLERNVGAQVVYSVSGGNAIGFLTDVPTEVEMKSAYRMTCDFSNVEEGIRVIGTLEIATDLSVEDPVFEELVTWDARAKIQEILETAGSVAPNFPVTEAALH